MNEIGIIALAALGFMTLVFALSQKMKRLDVVDIAWGWAFIVIASISLFLGEKGMLQYLVTLLVVIWGVRLSASILKRFKHSSEDPRYREMRKNWRKNAAANAYVRVFLLQGFLALVILASVIAINLSTETSISATAIIGTTVWLVGFLFESIGDAQLRQHLASPKNVGKIMTGGLWRYTRHPNYFGEAMQWWGIFIIALSVPFGWISVVAPATITILLLFVSGVPLTEKRFEGRPGWEAYKKRTSVFLPLPPKK